VSDRSDAFEVLAALDRVFEAAGVRWYLFGAQAVIVWGRPRLTADVDVTVALAPAEVERILPPLEAASFDPRPEHPSDFVLKTRILPLIHQPTGIPVDLVFAGPGLEMEFLENAREIDISGLEIPVISPEDLVIAKVLAGRPKDMEDAESVVAEQADALDLGRIRHWLGRLEEALDRRDLLPEVECMVERSRRRG
jgi:hypothetical protein